MKIGNQVIVTEKNLGNNKNTLWASQYIGQPGVIEAKCKIYKNSWLVRFQDNGLASFLPQWLTVQESVTNES